jgi:hypothetical protein
MQRVDMSCVRYVGGDIVEELVRINQARYGSDSVSFMQCNLLEDALPQADMVIVRDCLVHMSLADATRALRNIEQSGSRYLLTTTFTEVTDNADIVTGEWRRLNLEKPPFRMPPAKEYLLEECNGCGDGGGKALGLWEIH